MCTQHQLVHGGRVVVAAPGEDGTATLKLAELCLGGREVDLVVQVGLGLVVLVAPDDLVSAVAWGGFRTGGHVCEKGLIRVCQFGSIKDLSRANITKTNEKLTKPRVGRAGGYLSH